VALGGVGPYRPQTGGRCRPRYRVRPRIAHVMSFVGRPEARTVGMDPAETAAAEQGPCFPWQQRVGVARGAQYV
jgi:hypothetical protein